VKTGKPEPVSENEGSRVADAVSAMGLQYVVLTSVTRDDLHDGGASFFAEIIRTLKNRAPHIKIEVLIPDFNGQVHALKTVIDERPDVLNHNLEVPEVLYPYINRKKENYARSLQILEEAKKMGAVTKSGIMLGLGETGDDVLHVLQDLRRIDCDLLTIGQYLKANPENINVKKYVSPEEFEQLKKKALSMGFIDVEAGPLVRSSYNAHKIYRSIQKGVV
jgi:lipoic acid synthetase